MTTIAATQLHHAVDLRVLSDCTSFSRMQDPRLGGAAVDARWPINPLQDLQIQAPVTGIAKRFTHSCPLRSGCHPLSAYLGVTTEFLGVGDHNFETQYSSEYLL